MKSGWLKVLVFCCICWLGQTASAQRDADSLPKRLQAVQQQIDGAAAVRGIKRLQHSYGQYVGAGQWQAAAALFTDDAVAYFGEQKVSGRQAIASFLQGNKAAQGLQDGELNETLLLSPVIHVEADGKQAQGRWRQVTLLGNYQHNAAWDAGIHENRYRLQDGKWLISELHYYPLFGGPYAQGFRMYKEEKQESVRPVPFHYDANGAGVPVAARPANTETGETDPPKLAQQAAKLLATANRLLDEDAVLNLQMAYGYYLDRQMWDDLAELFGSDGTLRWSRLGSLRGREQIRAALKASGPSPLPKDVINDHLQMQPVIQWSADGQSASTRGTELLMLGKFQGKQQLGLSIYHNEFAKVKGTWQIRSVQVTTRMLTDYGKGWGDSALTDADCLSAYKGDRDAVKVPAPYPSAASAAVALDVLVSTAAAKPVAVDASKLAAVVDDLELKARKLNARDGTENVANAYGYYIDEFLWDDMADLFAVDGWKELSYIGSYVGRERIRQSVISRYGRGGRRANGMTFHQKTQPFITVSGDGRSAMIRIRLFQLNGARTNPGSYISGIYEDRTVNENGIWKLSAMDLDYAWLANYEEGWAHVVPGSSARYAPPPGSMKGEQAPDRPLRGVVVAPYPEGPVDMGFHYKNPVSGRMPPLYLPDFDYTRLKFVP